MARRRGRAPAPGTPPARWRRGAPHRVASPGPRGVGGPAATRAPRRRQDARHGGMQRRECWSPVRGGPNRGPDMAKMMQQVARVNMGDQMKARIRVPERTAEWGPTGGRRGPVAQASPEAQPPRIEPADFHSPEGAVKAFLSALKAKDADRLNEATALRAQPEASSTRNRDDLQENLRPGPLRFRARRSGQEARRLPDRRREPPGKHRTRRTSSSARPGKNGAYTRRR